MAEAGHTLKGACEVAGSLLIRDRPDVTGVRIYDSAFLWISCKERCELAQSVDFEGFQPPAKQSRI